MRRPALLGFALLALTSCRAKEGERCVCAGDCAAGLVCALEGGAVLENDACAPNGSAGGGMCLPAGSNGDDSSGVLTDAPLFMDLGSKRDFDPSPGSTSDTGTSGSGTATSGASSTSATAGSTSATAGPGSGSGSGTSSTGSTGATAGSGASSGG